MIPTIERQPLKQNDEIILLPLALLLLIGRVYAAKRGSVNKKQAGLGQLLTLLIPQLDRDERSVPYVRDVLQRVNHGIRMVADRKIDWFL